MKNIPEHSAQSYDEIYAKGGYDKTYFLDPEDCSYCATWKTVLNKINKKHRIGDFGCGPGQFIELAVRAGYEVSFGIDFSKVALKMASNRNISNTQLIFGDLNDHVLINSVYPKYEVAVICEVLEHISDDVELLSKLGSNKLVVFTVPNYTAKTHVRFFKNKKEIKERYSSVVDIATINTIKIFPKTESKSAIFVVSGIIK